MNDKAKIVGVFKGTLCSIYVNGEHFAIIWNLKYNGCASELTDRRMYSNSDTSIWFDYAVYE